MRVKSLLDDLALTSVDRGNIGNAKVAGMNTDLKLTGSQYNIALTVSHTIQRVWNLPSHALQVFFLTYATLEVPSNIILKMFKRPSWWIALIMVSRSFFQNYLVLR